MRISFDGIRRASTSTLGATHRARARSKGESSRLGRACRAPGSAGAPSPPARGPPTPASSPLLLRLVLLQLLKPPLPSGGSPKPCGGVPALSSRVWAPAPPAASTGAPAVPGRVCAAQDMHSDQGGLPGTMMFTRNVKGARLTLCGKPVPKCTDQSTSERAARTSSGGPARQQVQETVDLHEVDMQCMHQQSYCTSWATPTHEPAPGLPGCPHGGTRTTQRNLTQGNAPQGRQGARDMERGRVQLDVVHGSQAEHRLGGGHLLPVLQVVAPAHLRSPGADHCAQLPKEASSPCSTLAARLCIVRAHTIVL